MKTNLMVALSFALIGIIFLTGGIGSSLSVTTSKVTCEACGMLIQKTDISTFQVVAQDDSEHWACCPICAEVVGLYYQNADLNAKCFVSGSPLKIIVANGNFSSVSGPSGSNEVTVVLGGSCITNKIVANQAYAQQVKQSYEWASNASLKTVPQSFVSANNKLSQMTVSYQPVSIPAINYILMSVGVAFLAASPVAFKLLKKGKLETVIPQSQSSI